MSKKFQIAAVIDIGSKELRLNIAQATKPESERDIEAVKYLETLSYPLSLGRDTFQAGKMSFDKVDKACEVIKNFLHVAKGYGIRDVRTVATTAMREAANMDYILDQIKIKTGVSVDVIDHLEEKRHIYRLLTHYGEEFLKESAIAVYIGTGTLGVVLFQNGKMPRTWNIRVGSLRMGEMFGQMQEYTREFYKLMEEYLAGYTYKLRDELPPDIQHFIVSGQEVDVISRLILNETKEISRPLFEIPRRGFESLYDKIKRKTTDRIAIDHNIDVEKAESVLPAACIYQNLLSCTQAKTITASRLLPGDAILFEMLHPKRFQAIDKRFARGTILCAGEMLRRYGANADHGELVSDFAIMIFDKIKKLHGLGSRDKLLLTAAALLHDIGEIVNNRDHPEISYQIVRHSDIVGLTQMEHEIVALICKYHSHSTPNLSDQCYASLDAGTKVRISKLSAMLRLADALDRSHTQKYNRIDVKLTDETLIITISTFANVALEQWSFTEKSHFFEEVFGIKAHLRIKKA